jgi:hypothetical protein
MNTSLANALKKIIAEKGEAVLDNTKQVNSLLSDYAAKEPKPEKKALITCLMDGYHKELKNVPETGRLDCKIRLAQKLRNDEGLDLSLCENALDILESVLFGKLTLWPQPVRPTPPAPPPPANNPPPVPKPIHQPPAQQPPVQYPVTPSTPPQPVQVFTKFCSHCGAGLVDGAVLCVKCGCKVGEIKSDDARSGGFAFLSFCFPFLGLVLFFIWHKSKPLKAKSCLKGFWVAIISYIIICFLYNAFILGLLL